MSAANSTSDQIMGSANSSDTKSDTAIHPSDIIRILTGIIGTNASHIDDANNRRDADPGQWSVARSTARTNEFFTHKRPSDNMQISPMRLARGSCSFHMAGIG